jgi:hypothetical protein
VLKERIERGNEGNSLWRIIAKEDVEVWYLQATVLSRSVHTRYGQSCDPI